MNRWKIASSLVMSNIKALTERWTGFTSHRQLCYVRDKQGDKQREKLRELRGIVYKCLESTISANQFRIKITFKAYYTNTLLIQKS